MARFNTTSHTTRPAVADATSPIATVSTTPDTRTFEGAAGWTFTSQAELYRLATGTLLDGKGSFYESGGEQDARLRALVTKVALEDPQWGLDFATWLRGPGNIRTGALMFAADFVKARLDEQKRLSMNPGPAAVTLKGDEGINRRIIRAVCQRADEPGELLAYWTASYGRGIPQPVKRGLADAVRRLYNERMLLKYDTASKGYRFGDILNLVHPRPKEMVGVPQWRYHVEGYEECPTPLKRRYATAEGVPTIHHKDQSPLRAYACKCGWYHATSSLTTYGKQVVIDDLERRVNRLFTGEGTQQGDLFQYALDRRHNPDTAVIPESSRLLAGHHTLMQLPVTERRAVVVAPGGSERLNGAGFTWQMLAGWLQGPMDKAVWEAMIPNMGIMALIRNLRNFDQAGVSDEVAQQIIARLTDPEVIAKSRQFPFRFLAAHRATENAGSLRWGYPLEKALNLSLTNVPHLGGRTLILVDRSPSMFPGYYRENETDKRLGIPRADQAAIFGCALALRAENATLVEFGGTSKEITIPKGGSILPLVDQFDMIGYTDIPSAVKRHYRNHDRVVVITDEQTRGGFFPSNRGGYHGGMPETPIDALVPLDVPVFMWNLAGYTAGAMPSGSKARFALGGLTDKAFTLVPLLEAGAQGVWPWQVSATA